MLERLQIEARSNWLKAAVQPGTLLVTILFFVTGCETLQPTNAVPDQGKQAIPEHQGRPQVTSESGAAVFPPSKSTLNRDSKPDNRTKATTPATHSGVASSSDRENDQVYLPGTERFVLPPISGPAKPGVKGNVTLNFENTNIREVVKVILGDLLNENYVIDPGVQGTVTLQTSRPLPREALLSSLEMLLRMNAAALVQDRELYKVVPIEEGPVGLVTPQLGDAATALPRGYSIRIVPLRFVAAKEMQKILEPLVAPGNIIRVDLDRNLLILAGTKEEVVQLLETIRVFDVDWMKGMSVALFTPEFAEAKALVEELEKIFGDPKEGPLAGLVRFVAIERINALLVMTPRRAYLDKVADWVRRLDRDTGGTGQRLFVYAVQNGRATDLADVLNQVFGGESARQALPKPELAPGLKPAEISSRIGTALRERPTGATQSPVSTPASREQAQTLVVGTDGAFGTGASPGATPSSPEQGRFAADTESPSGAKQRPAHPPAGGEQGEAIDMDAENPVRVIPDEVTNALLILATPRQYRQVLGALRKLDTLPLQVLIDATLADVTLTDALSYGVEWFFKNSLNDKTGITRLGSESISLPPSFNGFSFSIVDAAGMVQALLRALAEDNKLDVIASPSLMVLNNQAAAINIGDEVPIITQRQQAVTGQANVINSVERQRTGVLLTVTPRVNAGGLVIMDINQNVSEVDERTVNSDVGPTIVNREITSTVAVQSGETMVLGGLIREVNTFGKSGIPVLYKLPLIGPLFGSTSVTKRRTELIVLLTPRAVQSQRENQEIIEEFSYRMQGIRPWPLERQQPGM